MGRRRYRKLTQRIRELEQWKAKLESIYDIEEVLYWRKHITRWDTFLGLLSRDKAIEKCVEHLTPLPPELGEIIAQYAS